jgi:hypothetical protein
MTIDLAVRIAAVIATLLATLVALRSPRPFGLTFNKNGSPPYIDLIDMHKNLTFIYECRLRLMVLWIVPVSPIITVGIFDNTFNQHEMKFGLRLHLRATYFTSKDHWWRFCRWLPRWALYTKFDLTTDVGRRSFRRQS